MQAAFPLIVIAGPTGSGKTPLALHLAVRFHGAIVNFDSMQVYRDLDLGTAKPSREELARVPHHFIGEVAPDAVFTAGEYARRARARIAELNQRGELPVLVGGTGFYLRALLEGLFPGPPRDEALRVRLRQRAAARGPEYVHRLLRRLDPAAAAGVAPRDVARAIRAVEVRLRSGRRMSELWREHPPEALAGVRALKLGLNPPRAALYARIDRRAEAMFAGGIQAETSGLLERYPPSLPVFAAHGYKQACDILLRGAAPAAALAEAQQEQRRYAKRQWTWFRRDPTLHWLDGFGDDAAVQRAAASWVEERLQG